MHLCSLTDAVLEGFNIAVYEWMETIPSLWPTVKGARAPDYYWLLRNADPNTVTVEFTKLYPQYLAPNNSMEFISDNDGSEYNGCHCELFHPVIGVASR